MFEHSKQTPAETSEARNRPHRIETGGEFFIWLIERLREQGKPKRLDRTTAKAFTDFVRALSRETEFDRAPVTTGRLRRATEDADGCLIGSAALAHIGALGDRLALSPDLPHAVSIESCVVNALWAWDRWEKFIDADAGAKTIRLRSTPKAERRFSVKIDVRIPSYDV